jgi:ribosomal-protein-alanine N-acetyltransferase
LQRESGEKMARILFETDRLRVREADLSDEDVEFFHALWTNPKIMTFVGYPHGLKITRDEIRRNIEKHSGSDFDSRLIIELKESSRILGECKMGPPDEGGVSLTDVKILPEYWGHGYGSEVKRGLVEYLFTHTDCTKIKATPNKNNIASQRMQEAIGAKRTGEGIYHFPEDMKDYTVDVPYYVYIVEKRDWERKRNERKKFSAAGKDEN